MTNTPNPQGNGLDKIEAILKAYKNYTIELVLLLPSSVKHRKLNADQAKQQIQQLIEEAYQRGYADGSIKQEELHKEILNKIRG